LLINSIFGKSYNIINRISTNIVHYSTNLGFLQNLKWIWDILKILLPVLQLICKLQSSRCYIWLFEFLIKKRGNKVDISNCFITICDYLSDDVLNLFIHGLRNHDLKESPNFWCFSHFLKYFKFKLRWSYNLEDRFEGLDTLGFLEKFDRGVVGRGDVLQNDLAFIEVPYNISQ
jgi:hypothetical protein